jgi:benzoate-CoA ligase family protein
MSSHTSERMTAAAPRSHEEQVVYYNATDDLLGRNLAPGRRHRPYLLTAARAWTYEEAVAAADAAGAGFLDLGLQRGDRVILATRDRPEFVFAFWGAMKAGLVPVPVAQGLSTSDLHFLLIDSEARAALCDSSSADALLPAAQRSGAAVVFVGASPPSDAREWAQVCARKGALSPVATTAEDVALWLYTSGTTGLPKAVMHRHGHLRAAPAGLSRQVIAMTPEDRVLSVSRMFFAYGLGNSVYLPAAAGASVVVNEGPVVPALVNDLLERAAPTVLFGVPTFFDGFARLANARLPGTVRIALSAGESLSAAVFERFRAAFGASLLDGLGATEALHHVTSNRLDDVVVGSAGRPLDGYDVEVRDREGAAVAEGASGELWLRGPTTFAGYWRRPDLTARAFRDGWMRTGDLVRVVDGRVFHEGRLDDLIKLGGVWVAPVEIEDVLRGHKDVVDAAVVAVDVGSGVPLLKAVVAAQRDDAAFARELRLLCRGRLATFKVPQVFEVVEELPRTPTGKLRRFVLRQGAPGP